MAGGPVLLRGGGLHVTGPGVDEHETRAAICSCGQHANAPYCDAADVHQLATAPRGQERPRGVRRASPGAVLGAARISGFQW